ncbi:MAG: hypothetical protein ACXV7D_02480 [Thermoanaerobaculia bacterium]
MRLRNAVVAAVALSVAMASRAASDHVLLRTGGTKTGNLKSCIGSRCQLGAQSIPRDDIAWIGLDIKTASSPPAVVNKFEDEVHLRDGTVETAHVIGLNLGQIVTEQSNFNRSDVAWIHFTPPVKNDGPIVDDSGDQPAAPEPQPPTPTPPATRPPKKTKQNPPPPQPQPPNKPPVKRPPSQSMKPCPADNPMGGQVIYDASYDRNRGRGCIVNVHAVLRFPLVRGWLTPAETPWPYQVASGFNESEIDYQISSTGCSGTVGNRQCFEPAKQKTGKWVRTPRQTTAPSIKVDVLKPELSVAVLPQDISAAFIGVPFECKGPSGGGTTRETIGVRGFDITGQSKFCTERSGPNPLAETAIFVSCVAPGDCLRNDSLPQEDCVKHADRHAVFPFFGEASLQSNNSNQELLSTKIRWDICCGCASLPNPPDVIPRTPEKRDCKEELAKLEGRKKGLEDAADIDRKDLANKQYLRDKAFKEVSGEALLKFSNALLGLASKGGEGALSKILGLVAAVISNQDEQSALSNLGVAVEAAASPGSFQPALQHAIEEANEAAEAFLAQNPGNLAGAQKVYLEGLKEAGEGFENTQNGLELVAFVIAFHDLYDASEKFADKLSEYDEAENEFNEAGEHLENIEDQIKDVDVEIQKLLADCPEGGEPESAQLVGDHGPFRLIANTTPPRTAAKSATPDPLMDKATKLRGMVEQTNQRIVKSVVPMLLPFLSHQWRNVRREFLIAAVKAVEPDLRAAVNEVQQEVALGHEIEQSMKAKAQSGQHASKEERRSDGAAGHGHVEPSIAKR